MAKPIEGPIDRGDRGLRWILSDGNEYSLPVQSARLCVAYVDFSGVTSDAETITISDDADADGEVRTDVFEFDTDDDVVSGNVKVDVSSSATAAASATALAAAINEIGQQSDLHNCAFNYAAVVLKNGTTVAIYSTSKRSRLDLSESGANVTVVDGASYEDIKSPIIARAKHTVTASEASRGTIAIAFEFSPDQVHVQVRTVTSKAIKNIDGDIHFDGQVVILNKDGDTDFIEGDEIFVLAFGSL